MKSIYNDHVYRDLKVLTNNIKSKFEVDWKVYIPCVEGEMHLVTVKRNGAVHFHNHSKEELYSYVTLDTLTAQDFNNTSLCGCALLFRFLKSKDKEKLLSNYRYTSTFFYKRNGTNDLTASKTQFLSWVASPFISELFLNRPSCIRSDRKALQDKLDTVKVFPVRERFQASQKTILHLIKQVCVYKSYKEYRGDYTEESNPSSLNLEFGEKFSLVTRETPKKDRWGGQQKDRRGRPVYEESQVVILPKTWIAQNLIPGLALFNDKIITEVVKRYYEGCYLVRLLVNSRGFTFTEKTYRIFIQEKKPVTVEFNVCHMEQATYNKYKTVICNYGTMEEVK